MVVCSLFEVEPFSKHFSGASIDFQLSSPLKSIRYATTVIGTAPGVGFVSISSFSLQYLVKRSSSS